MSIITDGDSLVIETIQGEQNGVCKSCMQRLQK